jgi:hypothetical protein
MRFAPLLFAASALGVSFAQAEGPDDHDDEEPHYKTALIEAAIAFAIPAFEYWRMPTNDNVDIDLAWDWESWHDKLTGDAIRFDTNPFHINAFRHPIFGAVTYHTGRVNGLGMTGSTILTAASIVAWEFIVEYREYPSLNDLIINTTTGLQIGESMWQIGQLWRGGELSTGDRLKTALFSPIDAGHDVVLPHRKKLWRRPAWRSIVLEGGLSRRRLDDDQTVSEVVLAGDIDVVRDRHYLAAGPVVGAIEPGTWSRVRGQMRIGDVEDGNELTAMHFQTRTALAGSYQQDGAGTGRFVAAGTAFTYRRDRLPSTWDHVAIAHILGPQFQVSRRTPAYAMRFDGSAYGDFALIDSHALSRVDPFAGPPPYMNKLQSHGYYDGIGASAGARLRLDSFAWSVDAEADLHTIWQLPGPDRIQTSELRVLVPADPHGAFDVRGYWRAQLGRRFRTFGLAAAAEGTVRHGTWKNVERTTYEHVLEALAQLAW